MMQNETALEAINQFFKSANTLLLIEGKAGSGKTHILNSIINKIQISHNVIRLKGSASIHPGQLTNLLTKNWNVEVKDKHARLETKLYEILLSLQAQDQSYVLIIDDAHLLSFAMMAALSHLSIMQEQLHTHLHIILLGRAPLYKKMQNLQIKSIPLLQLDKDTVPSASETPATNLPLNFLQRHKTRITAVASLAVFGLVMSWYYHLPTQPITVAVTKPPQALPLQVTPAPQPTTISKTQTVNLENQLLNTKTAKLPKHLPLNVRPSDLVEAAHQGHFVIQLMGSRHKETLQQFAQSHHLNNIAIHKVKSHWFIMTYGEFQNLQQAKDSLAHLPKNMQTLHPWIRPENLRG